MFVPNKEGLDISLEGRMIYSNVETNLMYLNYDNTNSLYSYVL